MLLGTVIGVLLIFTFFIMPMIAGLVIIFGIPIALWFRCLFYYMKKDAEDKFN